MKLEQARKLKVKDRVLLDGKPGEVYAKDEHFLVVITDEVNGTSGITGIINLK